MEIITDASGAVKVGDTLLPGDFQSISIDGEVLIDEVEIEGKAKRAKQIKGYNDASVSLALKLKNDEKSTPYDKLQEIQNVFKKSGQDTPVVYDIYNRHLKVRGITKVVFKKLTSTEDNQTDILNVACEFEEYTTINIEVKSSSSSSSESADSASIQSSEAPSSGADNDTPTRKSGKVTAQSGLNVRKGPGTDFGIARAIPYGTRIDIFETQDDWHKLDDGWVSGQYVELL